MKKYMILILVLCVILSGCGNSQANNPETETAETVASGINTGNADAAITVYPLPDSTMDTLDNATIAISLKEGDAYVDDTGIMRMDVKVYSYDLYDMVDIAGLKAGDTMVTHSGEVTVASVERNEFGTVLINGGLDNGGFDLFGDGGVYYEVGYSDIKNWYEVGEVTLRVSVDLEFRDNMDLEKGEQIYYAGSFLVGEVTDYHFTPQNTTVRTENGQIVSMERIYTP
jgi:hypothetical protein